MDTWRMLNEGELVVGPTEAGGLIVARQKAARGEPEVVERLRAVASRPACLGDTPTYQAEVHA